ncbi:alcohol oxidase [Xylariales sp. PMI_506]|nr:alcohol oxidase [Xylariales sp. PMI_506]
MSSKVASTLLLPRCLALALIWCWACAATTVTNDTAIAAGKTFDYVIVGAGLSGITVGNKLSAAGFSVLIIEAGPDPRWNPAVYNAEDRFNLDGYCDWSYKAYDDDGTPLSITLDSGKCIGGSTSINGLVWYRPTAAEIDKLESFGNPGWNWASLEPYMKAIEHNQPPDAIQVAEGANEDPLVHGFHGAINVSFPTPMRIPKAQELYKEALPLAFPGLVVGDDLSNRTSVVSASTSWTIWYDPVTGKNRRSSAADGLLWAEDQQRETLTVLATHKVATVLFAGGDDGDGLSATGVTTGTGTSPPLSTVYARKEVLLAAGSLASAPLLERSGIGRADVLGSFGIEARVDLPGVGANLNDQPGTGTSALVTESYWNDTELIDGRILFGPVISLVNVDEIWGSDAASYIDNLTSAGALTERAQALVDAGAAATVEGAELILNTTIDLIINSRLPVAEVLSESYPTVLSAIFWPLTPLSRGHVHIAAADPFADPIITPRFLRDPFDQAVAVGVARRSRDLFSAAPFSSPDNNNNINNDAVVADAYYDPASLGPDATDAEYLAWFQSTAGAADHWIGSTAMIPRELGGVVDSKLRVYGTQNLRVVDAGILPIQLTSHLMSTVYAVAQKAADIILESA